MSGHSDCLPGLLPASYRGVKFWVLDADHEAGRRIASTMFPGRDGAYHDDLGQHAGDIRLSALVIGDDYIIQARRLERALNARGPATLVHPWWGEINAVVSRPAGIKVASDSLRMVSFDLVFQKSTAPVPGPLSTLAAMMGAVAGLINAADTLAVAALSPAVLPVALWRGAGDTAAGWAGVVLKAVERHSGASILAPAIAPGIAALNAARTLPGSVNAADRLVKALTSLPTTLAATVLRPPPPAIGRPILPDDGMIRPTLDMLLTTTSRIAGLGVALPVPEAALALAIECALLAAALRLVQQITLASRQEASALRACLEAALAAAADRVAGLAGDLPGQAAALRAALATAAWAVARDLDEVGGRLPSVRVIDQQATVSVWLVAMATAGDHPAQLTKLVDDITRRNRLSHPGAVAGTVEVLT